MFIVCSVPLTVTTALYNQSDLPKNAMLVFTGGAFIAAVIFYILLNRTGKDEQFLYFNKQLDPYILVFLASAVLSTVLSINPYISFWGQYQRQGGLNLYIYLVLLYFLASAVLTDSRNISKLLLAMELTAAVVSLYAILQDFDTDPFTIQPAGEKRPVSTIGNSVFLGGFLIMVLPVSVLNSSGKKNVVLKYLLPLLIFTGIIVSRTRTAYIALVIQIVMFWIFYIRTGSAKSSWDFKFSGKTAMISGGALLLFIVLIIAFPDNKFAARFLSIFGETSNPRWLLWRDSMNIFYKYPLFGPGIGMFPNALEEFYSYQLRYTDTMHYFDHAHNNYLHALFTMGAAGLAVYFLFLLTLFRLCFRGFLDNFLEKKQRMLFFSLMLMLAGYAAYGLTNFDDISILLYLFTFAAVIKGLQKDNTSLSLKKNIRIPVIGFGVVLMSFLGYNAYSSYTKIEADIHFFKGAKNFSAQKFRDGANEINMAIYGNENCSLYRYLLALNVYRFVILSTKIDEAGKNTLLVQALEETERAKKNFINENDCDALRSLILYELGRTDEASRLKDEVLRKNIINPDYRVNLAYYYFNSGDTAAADEQLKLVMDIIPGSVNALNAAAFFSFKRGEMDKARFYCNKIFEFDPGNRSATELMKYIK
jgi:O-antigen ligase